MSAADKLPPINRRRALTALAVGLVAPGALAACSKVTTGGGAINNSTAPASASLAFEPATSATDVAPRAPVSVKVTGGRFERVALTNTGGKVVAGSLNEDKTTFTTSEPLGYGATYTWSGSAVGEDGKAVPVLGEFRTLDPATQVSGRFQLADGQTVGVAAPVILQFDAAIDDADRATVERALSVTTTPETEGSWAWLPDEAGGSRVHWRSREYFEPGTTVRVDAKLYGVKFGEDAYGAADSSLDFTIGRRQVVKAEASSHRIQVIDQAGAVIMDFPCSYGEGDLDRNVTRSGIHVVTEKYEDFYMTNPAAGYANVRERFAVRISNNGEFIHANPASSGAQGNSNVTNGCINLSLSDAEQYFNTAVYGDPVEVTGTRIDLSYADGDIWDWAVSWDEWKSMSALSDKASPAGIPDTAPATPSGAPQPAGGRPGG
ncbi:Ig-like domain-containing protein [Mycolicibacterium sp. F2034L]|uniref:L,D-transpeptidase n=1 Tax=Mycolicibacterium sp. F2034L TaxID=2926422 RepID=UPI001FF3FC34|nr:Ig-like domain-containing protein [Mycolicibacterium sp. F2034L]MCK0175726.1 Ig-like domain-containing protein [Mycolicibacterium sp. F2034L]